MTASQLLKYLKNTEFDVQSAKASLFVGEFVFIAYVNSKIVKGASLSRMFSYMPFDPMSQFYEIIPKEALIKYDRKVYLDYLKNPHSLAGKINSAHVLSGRLDLLWKKFNGKNIKNQTYADLLKLYKKLLPASMAWWSYACLTESKGKIIDAEIIPEFARNHGLAEGRAREIINILSHPEKRAVFNQERKDFLEICDYILSRQQLKKHFKIKDFGRLLGDKTLKSQINSYIKNYFWIKTDFYQTQELTPALVLADVAAELSGKNKFRIKKDIQTMMDIWQNIKRQKREIRQQIKLTPAEKKDIKFAELVIQWQDERKPETMKDFYYVLTLMKEFSNRLKVDYKDLVACALDEVEKVLFKGKKVPHKTGEVFVVYEKNKKPRMFFGDYPEKMLEAVLKVGDGKEIKGVVASRAGSEKLKGIARIINNPGKDEFNEGEILVTSMTRVEFVPLMRIAKAIITDEGGIACHAAIISRELGIPCIIGTKIATKVLKDGDLVEVDIQKGLIKALK